MISIFTDGSSRGNPGPGGWGSVVVNDGKVIELGGGEKHTTNNRMELMAAISGLRAVPEGAQAKVFADSSYVINGITKWVHGWKRNGWKTKTKDDVLNVDLWKMLDDAVAKVGSKNVVWEYVGGHIGIVGNERCDEIATAFADSESPVLYQGPLSEYSIPNILDVSHDEILLKAKKSNSSKSKSGAKAYSYVSSVGGKIEIHRTWVECEKRVKGAKGARFKKSFSADNEKEVISEFGGASF
ncbi:MAG: ribonuclease HI [Patescibacteria group bacterium]|mgnify:CR=1 FL=1